MNQLITRIRGQLGQLNERLSGATKLAIGLILGLAVLLGIFIAYDASKEEFEALEMEYTAEQVSQVQRVLTEQSIPYQTPGAGVIMVPSAQSRHVMHLLATQGITGEIKYDITKMGTSLSAKAQAEYLRRHQEEVLAHTIAALEPVRRAKVSLSMPRESVFLKETRPASASVMLTLKPGQSLSKKQVQGIIQMVSGGVSGLNADNVVIVDQNSNILSENKDGPFGGSGDLQSFRNREEARLIQAISRQLERIVGPNNYEVTVQAEMDTRTLEIEQHDVDPKRVVSVSEQSVVETQTNSAPNVGGQAGAAANANGGGVVRTGTNSDRNREANNVTNEPSRKRTRTIRTQPELKRLSVSVLVNGRYEAAKGKDGKPVEVAEDEEGPAPVYVPLTEDELAQIKKVIVGAANIDTARGDRLELVNSEFTRPPQLGGDEPFDVMTKERLMEKGIKYGLLGVVSLALIFVVFRPMVRWLIAPPEEVEIIAEGALPAPDEDEAALPANEEVARIVAEGSPLEQIRQLAVQDPEAAAAVLRAWLRASNSNRFAA